VYRELGKWLRRSAEIKKLIFRRNEGGIYRRSIVWDYFLLRRKKFTDLKWKAPKL